MNSELLISIVNQVIYVPIRHHYKCRAIITYVVSALQINSFMQNKANFPESQMNANKVITKDYENETLGGSGKNKANSNPIKANLQKAKMNVNKVLTKDYENKSNWAICENKANFNPKQSQTKPIYRGVASGEAGFKRYPANIGHNELKYVDRLGQLTLNPFIKGIRKDLNSL